MKIAILYAGLATPHAGWVAIDELAELLAYYFDAEVQSPKVLPQSWLEHQIRPHQVTYEPLDTAGGDVLIVVARGPGDLGMVNAISDCRKKFGKIYGYVTDSYFQAGFVKETALFDAITVTAHEDMDFPQTRYQIPVHQLYQGADCLTWVPRITHHRDIDVLDGPHPPTKPVFPSVFTPPVRLICTCTRLWAIFLVPLFIWSVACFLNYCKEHEFPWLFIFMWSLKVAGHAP